MKKVKTVQTKREPVELVTLSPMTDEEKALTAGVIRDFRDYALPPVVETPIPVKVAQEPILQIEEIARGFRQYRPHHLHAIVSFCQARGYPLQGTKEQLLNTLQQFGW